MKILLKPQFIELSDHKYKNFYLSNLQYKLYNDYPNLPEVIILSAPTGSGKTFSFPLILEKLKEKDQLNPHRGIIVSPTNALIEDMYNSYKKNYPKIKVAIINAKKLDELNKKGKDQRWREILKIISDNELILTNPDIINYIISGGYFEGYKYKQKQWDNLFEQINYIIIDEYHLYDEEQIADILCWIQLKRELLPYKNLKFIFASATPEEELETILKESEITYEKIEERIKDKQEKSKIIHGEIEINFINKKDDDTILNYLLENKDKIKELIKKGGKILILFDRLKYLHQIKSKIKEIFKEFTVKEESGWKTKAKEKNNEIKEANIILGTNKLEQGVNLDVNIIFMETGKYLKNFLQRFGRIARGDKKGKAFIFTDNYSKIKKNFTEGEELEYYEFIEKLEKCIEKHKFYTEKVKPLLGAYLFSVVYHVTDYNLGKILKEKIEKIVEGESRIYYKILYSIHKKIKELQEIKIPKYEKDKKYWKDWWENFQSTYNLFRGDIITVKVLDREEGNLETEYSLEWIYRNKVIVEIKENKKGKIYVVDGTNQQPNKNYIFKISSIPLPPITTNLFTPDEKYKIREKIRENLKKLHKYYQDNDKFAETCREIIQKINLILPIFTSKRLKIESIETKEEVIFL